VHLTTGVALLHVGRDQLLFPHTWCLTLPPSIVWVKANADCGFVLRYVRISRVDVLAFRKLAILLKCVSCYKFGYSIIYLLTYSLTHSPTHSFTHSLSHSLSHSLTHSLTQLHTHSFTHSLSHSLTYLHTHSHTHSIALTHLITHSLT